MISHFPVMAFDFLTGSARRATPAEEAAYEAVCAAEMVYTLGPNGALIGRLRGLRPWVQLELDLVA